MNPRVHVGDISEARGFALESEATPVVVLDQDPSAGPERRGQAVEDLAAVREVFEHKSSVHEIEFVLGQCVGAQVDATHFDRIRGERLNEPGVDVVLFGTGDAGHLRSNIASLLKPPLPEADRAKLDALFSRLAVGIGLDSHQGR